MLPPHDLGCECFALAHECISPRTNLRIRVQIDQAVREHLPGISQEPQISSRIGQKLEEAMNGEINLSHEILVVTPDIPDRGPRSLESAIGADVCVGISAFSGGKRQSKEFLTQTKFVTS